MQQVTTHLPTNRISSNARLIQIVILGLIILASLFVMRSIINRQSSGSAPAETAISQETLAGKYGLRVNLIAVTAAGGMVDLRLKILDSAKARSLLEDKQNFPTLFIPTTDITLSVAPEIQAQAIQFENGGNIYLLFANAGGIVKPGTEVRVKFGGQVLEALISK